MYINVAACDFGLKAARAMLFVKIMWLLLFYDYRARAYEKATRDL